jgi:hypothetical protein
VLLPHVSSGHPHRLDAQVTYRIRTDLFGVDSVVVEWCRMHAGGRNQEARLASSCAGHLL